MCRGPSRRLALGNCATVHGVANIVGLGYEPLGTVADRVAALHIARRAANVPEELGRIWNLMGGRSPNKSCTVKHVAVHGGLAFAQEAPPTPRLLAPICFYRDHLFSLHSAVDGS